MEGSVIYNWRLGFAAGWTVIRLWFKSSSEHSYQRTWCVRRDRRLPRVGYFIKYTTHRNWRSCGRTNRVVFGPGLVATKGEQHRRQRKATLSVFGVPQLRQILPTLYNISEKVCNVLMLRARDLNSFSVVRCFILATYWQSNEDCWHFRLDVACRARISWKNRSWLQFWPSRFSS
jgi:hypothetical protein